MCCAGAWILPGCERLNLRRARSVYTVNMAQATVGGAGGKGGRAAGKGRAGCIGGRKGGKGVCSFWAKGECKRGDACLYHHEMDGMFGAPATPAFGMAPSLFGKPAPGGMCGAAPAAAAPATGGFGFGCTGGEMFEQQAPSTFCALGAPAAFGSTSGGFGGFGAPQVRAPSSPPRSLARSQPLHTGRLPCTVFSPVCDPWRNVMQSQPAKKLAGPAPARMWEG